jgi:DMSO reductase anchor subunit
MGYRVARKHAERLRRIAAGIGFLVPLLALIVILATAGWWELPLAILAAIAALLGTLIERWLFFAEATHTVVLYYGRQA